MSFISIGLYFVVMLCIGLFAYRKSTSDVSDYLLGGRNVSPQVTALSAGASDMSGWMLMGLPGAMFVMGFDAVFIAIGLVLGALANYLLVAPRLRVFTEVASDSLTIPEFLSQRFGHKASSLRLVSAIIIIVFFTLYTSAGLVAGGKLFDSAFGVDYQLGVLVTLVVVVSYTLLGGFLAVSLTDFVQGCIMFLALVIVPVVAFQQFDGVGEMADSAYQSIPTIAATWEGLTLIGLISSLAWGLGYFGQPHIIVRFMAIRSVAAVSVARNIGMSWMTVTIVGALATGLVGVAYVNKTGMSLSDPETIFIVFTDILFHPLVTGFLLAAILAAVMSTISSQLLVSASSLTEDIFSHFSKHKADAKKAVLISRAGVFGVGIVAMLLALDSNNSILGLVSNAWAGFGAAFGPLILFSLYSERLTHSAALAGMIVGAVTVIFCIYAPVLNGGETISSVVYEIVPGFILSSLAIWSVSLLDKSANERARDVFKESSRVLSEQY
ncbi:sodium/proline symporter PutP [Alteromonas sediminis]|uniref:Sodium/proline symporter n=1 Tax=Alteromonas sediminis TaxID=2259342 RepID=A0A3N5ZC45_9ALTE|nr:sodium/proline symporter PutP [Alteromonas sediminis]RPJ67368.1 sodium/proline symporter PutP [Alteromonas sediminis]